MQIQMAELPKTMKAWVVAKNGLPKDALVLRTDWPVPPPPTGANIMVKISHAALNPADIVLIGNVPSWLPFRKNAIPGLDFAGEVVRAGPSASAHVKVGTEVCGSLGVAQVAFGKGSLADYVVVPAHLVAVKPKHLSMAAAAGLMGVAGQTAALIMRAAKIQKGERVLVNGASGGVGTVLLQVLKASGAVTTAVCSGTNEALVRRLGADEVGNVSTFRRWTYC
jgi:NADPH:quinone reductase-like Zn-dependent oxidoreductase